VEALFSIHDLVRPETLSVRPLMLGAAIATLSYIGFDAISTLAEETIDAKRDIGFATILVCILQAAICVLTVYLASLVWPDYHSFRDPETAILDLGIKIGGNLLFDVLTFVLLVAGLASALTGQAGASRLLYAMDRDGVFFGHIFSYIHPNLRTPIIAIWTVTAVSVVGALAMHFQALVELLNFGAFVGFILVNLSVIQHYRIRSKQRGGRSLIDNVIFPFFGAFVCGYVWLSLGTYAKVVGFCWLGIGSILALLVRRFYRTTSHPLGLDNSSEWLK
jgi:amino acid transporter